MGPLPGALPVTTYVAGTPAPNSTLLLLLSSLWSSLQSPSSPTTSSSAESLSATAACLAAAAPPSWQRVLAWCILLIWLGMELAFYLVVYNVLVPQLSRVRRPPVNAKDGLQTMKRVLSTVHRLADVYGFEQFFQVCMRIQDHLDAGKLDP